MAAPLSTLTITVSAYDSGGGTSKYYSSITAIWIYESVNGATATQIGYAQPALKSSALQVSTSYAVTLTNLPAGSYSFFAKVSNAHGGSTGTVVSATKTLVIDNPPTIAMTQPSGNVRWVGSTTSVDVAGTISGAATLSAQLYIDGVSTQALTVSGSAVSGKATVPSTGSHTTFIRATDGLGLTADSSTTTIFADVSPSSVTISNPTGNYAVSGGQVTLPIAGTYIVNDGSSAQTAYLLMDGNATSVATLTASSGTVTGSYTTTTTGSHTFQTEVADAHGGVTVSPASTVYLDVAPTTTMTSPTTGNVVRSGSTATISVAGTVAVTDSSTPTAVLLMDGTQVSTLTVSGTAVSGTYAATATGSHTFAIKVTDGHAGTTTSAASTVYIDTAPTTIMTSPVAGNVVQSGSTASIVVAGTVAVSDGSTPTAVLLMDGTQVATLTVSGTSVTASYAATATGSHVFSIKVSDGHGGSTISSEATVYIDVPPVVTMSSPSGAVVWDGSRAAITVAGTVAVSDSSTPTASLLMDGVVVSTLTVSSSTVSGSYAATITGSHTFAIRASDGHGGTTTGTANTVFIDLPPSVTLTSPTNGGAYALDSTGVALVSIVGAGADTDGTISKVEALVDGTVVNTASTASISYSYSASVGTHSVYLRVTDNSGAVTSGTAASFTVTTLQTITVPSATALKAGSLPGQMDVAAGKATYHLPISLPPGVNGMVPSVSLSYGGGTDMGYLGVGWSLGAGSTIQRCPPTIIQDGRIDTVRLTTSDRLCLDGKRLVLAVALPTGCNSASSTWPACFNTAYWSTSAQYRTEIESGTKVVWNGAGFETYTKDGQINFYGNAGDASDPTVRFGTVTSTSTAVIHAWSLRQTQDRFGNEIDYYYNSDLSPAVIDSTGEQRLTEIRWGANANASQGNFARVLFTYEVRPDADSYYIAGGRADRSMRVSKITTYTDTASDGSGGTEALQYTLSYVLSPTSQRSLVQSIQVCSATAGDCLPASTFTYGQPDSSVIPSFKSRGTWVGPVLEDGESGYDCTVVSSGTKGHCGYGPSDMFVTGDFNDDGVPDLMTKHPRWDGTQPLTAYLNTGSGFSASAAAFNGVTIDASYRVILTGDFDGDGQTDVILAHPSTDTGFVYEESETRRMYDWTVCYSRMRQGQGFQCAAWPEAGALDASGVSQSSLYTVYDFDGDGRDDVYLSGVAYSTGGGVANSGAQRMCLSTGTGFNCQTMPGIAVDLGNGLDGKEVIDPKPAHTTSTDFDGDGRLDMVQYIEPYRSCAADDTPAQCVARPYTYTGTGAFINSYDETGTHSNEIYAFTGGAKTLTQGLGPAGDLNGDGYSDVALYVDSGGVFTYSRCQGRGQYSAATCVPVTAFPTTSTTIPASPWYVGDYDGDGSNKIVSSISSTSAQTCTLRGVSTTSLTPTCATTWGLNGLASDTFNSAAEGAQSAMMDLTGNGLNDQVSYAVGGKWTVYTPVSLAKSGEALDRLVSVTDGLGKKTQFAYALPGDSTVYSADATDSTGAMIAVTYPERRVPRMGTLVSKLLVDNGQGGTIERDYHYAGASRDQAGRGYLGFARVDVTDVSTNVTTTQWFDKSWPYLGMMTGSTTTQGSTLVAQTMQSLATGTVTLTNQLNAGVPVATGQASWQANGLDTVCPYVALSTTSKWDIDAGHSLFNTTASTVDSLDAWCNHTSETATTTGDGNTYTTVTAKTFNNDLTNWFIGQSLAAAATKTRGAACVVRRMSATFDPVYGVPTSQVVEPGGAQPASTCAPDGTADSLYTVTTTYDRTNTDGTINKLGLIRRTTQSWLDPVSQTTLTRVPQQVTAFEAKGRFAQTVQNAFGQATTTLYDDRNGTPTSHTDVNGLVTTSTTDAFGQETVAVDPESNEHRHLVRQCDANCPTGATSVVIDDTLHLNSVGSYTRISPASLSYRDDGGRALRSYTWGFDGRVIIADQRYDALGRHIQTDHPHFISDAAILVNTLVYDDLGRVTSSTVYGEANDARATTTGYAGRVTTVINPAGQKKIETKDALGLLVQATDAASNNTAYGRDPFGNLNRVTDPLGNVVKMSYDRLGRRTQLNDPDLGILNEKVDPAGRTYWTQSPKQLAASTSTTMTFDLLDRMTHRLEPDLESFWVFDTAIKGIGRLAESYTWVAGTGTKSYDRVHSYDSLGRPSMTVTTLDTTYTTTDSYDAYGRPATTTQQRGTTTRSFTSGYNAMGLHDRLTSEAGTILWQEKSQDAWDHEITAIEGALSLARAYDPHTTNLSSATWAVAASNQERYSETSNLYDVLSNLKQRNGRWNYNDPNTAVVQRSYQDVFTYDTMNRLQAAGAWSQPTETFTYDAIGNLTSKTSVASGGAYTYPTPGAGVVGPHAVKNIATLGGYTYDADGNMLTAPNAVSGTWTSFDMPLVLTKGTNSDSFVYGPEHQRVKQVRSSGTSLYYAGGIEVESSSAGVTMKTYWPGGLGVNIDAPTGSKVLWTPTDKLGNVRGYIDATGSVAEMLDYDAWGKRRNASGIGTPDILDGVTDNKGFTGHEMLDNLDLVHMNGRVYDPLIGRFLTADPYVQSPENSQSYNRYTYVWNNPTNLTDPTGFTVEPCMQTGHAVKMHCDAAVSDVGKLAPGDRIEIYALKNGAKLAVKVSANGDQSVVATAPGHAADAPVGNSREDSGSGIRGTKPAASAVWDRGENLFNPEYWNTCARGEVSCEAARAYKGLPGYQREPGLETSAPETWAYGSYGLVRAGAAGIAGLFMRSAEEASALDAVNMAATDATSLPPSILRYSQRTVAANSYGEEMAAGTWDWNRSGPLRVMQQEGCWVCYDNRRLLGAQQAGLTEVPVSVVNPAQVMPGSKVTWEQAFARRFNDARNVRAGGAVPRGGISAQPTEIP